MTDERRTQIEEIAKEYGFSFASAKAFLKEYFYKSNFCPNCGAKMKGGAG